MRQTGRQQSIESGMKKPSAPSAPHQQSHGEMSPFDFENVDDDSSPSAPTLRGDLLPMDGEASRLGLLDTADIYFPVRDFLDQHGFGTYLHEFQSREILLEDFPDLITDEFQDTLVEIFPKVFPRRRFVKFVRSELMGSVAPSQSADPPRVSHDSAPTSRPTQSVPQRERVPRISGPTDWSQYVQRLLKDRASEAAVYGIDGETLAKTSGITAPKSEVDFIIKLLQEGRHRRYTTIMNRGGKRAIPFNGIRHIIDNFPAAKGFAANEIIEDVDRAKKRQLVCWKTERCLLVALCRDLESADWLCDTRRGLVKIAKELEERGF